MALVPTQLYQVLKVEIRISEVKRSKGQLYLFDTCLGYMRSCSTTTITKREKIILDENEWVG